MSDDTPQKCLAHRLSLNSPQCKTTRSKETRALKQIQGRSLWPEVPVTGKTDYYAWHGTWKNPSLCPLLPRGQGEQSMEKPLVPADGRSTACPLRTLTLVPLLGDLRPNQPSQVRPPRARSAGTGHPAEHASPLHNLQRCLVLLRWPFRTRSGWHRDNWSGHADLMTPAPGLRTTTQSCRAHLSSSSRPR